LRILSIGSAALSVVGANHPSTDREMIARARDRPTAQPGRLFAQISQMVRGVLCGCRVGAVRRASVPVFGLW